MRFKFVASYYALCSPLQCFLPLEDNENKESTQSNYENTLRGARLGVGRQKLTPSTRGVKHHEVTVIITVLGGTENC
jgi:hypothetical protein